MLLRLCMLPGLILHDGTGQFMPNVDAVLRGTARAAAVVFVFGAAMWLLARDLRGSGDAIDAASSASLQRCGAFMPNKPTTAVGTPARWHDFARRASRSPWSSGPTSGP